MGPKTTDYCADTGALLQDPKHVLLPVLRLVDGWYQVTENDVEVQQISGAMTNLIYRCRSKQTGKFILARVFGSSDALFDRKDEQNIFLAVAHAGLGPQLLVTFGNGRLEEFILSENLTAARMRARDVAFCIAAALAAFHLTVGAELPQHHRTPVLFARMRAWALHVTQLYSPQELRDYGLADMAGQIDALERRLTARHPSWLGFCHNDLQYGNMLLQKARPGRTGLRLKADSGKERDGCGSQDLSNAAQVGGIEIRVIDYEYAGWNPVAFDIANHWCEYGADYHTPTPHALDYSRLPSSESQLAFTRAYVQAVRGLKRQVSPGVPKDFPAPASSGPENDSMEALQQLCGDERAVDGVARRLRADARAYIPASHLVWGLWGLLQARTSGVEFDFEAYASQRLHEFHASQHSQSILAEASVNS